MDTSQPARARLLVPDAAAGAGGGPIRRFVVGVDGSDSSIDALRPAVALAPAFSATVQAVSVWQYPPVVMDAFPTVVWRPEEDAQEIIAAAAHTVFGDAPPSWFTSTVSTGPAAKALIAASEGADLLVVGSRGHGGFVGLLLGSVSSACAEYARCPVLIMHKHNR